MQGMGMQTSCWGCKLLNKVCERGTINLSIGRIRNRYLFREKWYIKRKGFDVGVEPPHINTCSVHPPGSKVLVWSYELFGMVLGEGAVAIEILCYLVGSFIV